ncbi:unnamed protein product [Schistosoma turkestanicum]|nr:unnamed protein product [Schistosoma turkestanicum]
MTEKPLNDNSRRTTYSSIQQHIENLNLNHLNEDERQKVLAVVKKDFEVRAKERERLNRYRSSILRRDRELAAKSLTSATESTSCLLCGRAFILFINPKRICFNCQRDICQNCSQSVNAYNGYFCKMCLKEKDYRAMTCYWFYDTVIQRFREFGSTTVAKSLFGLKYSQVQNMAEEELWNLLFRSSSSKKNSVEYKESNKSYSVDEAKIAQINKLRNRLEKLMEETLAELCAIEKNNSLSPRQITWQHESVRGKFKKNACREMKSFIQILYITIEKERMSQGMNTKNITPYVLDTLETEISRLVGHSVKGITDTNSLTGDDDKESVTMVDRDGVENRLAEILFDKLYSDLNPTKQENVQQFTFQTSSPVSTDANFNKLSADSINNDSNHLNKTEELIVTEGFPVRLEYTLPYNEHCEFHWYKLTNDNQRIPVKLDFRIEHVITGTINQSFKQYQPFNYQYPKHPFVLSNSGLITNETKQKLNQWISELSKLQSTNHGNEEDIIYLQHHLIIWTSRFDDTGSYFASVESQLHNNGKSSMKEKEYIVRVIKSKQTLANPQRQPEFIEPLIVQPVNNTTNDPFIEMTCIVTGNPIPRCLFYRNSSPIPVVVMPFVKIQPNESSLLLCTLSSLTQKYTVTISDSTRSDRSIDCTRKITLHINRPSSSEDMATYSCRAWNCHGRTITSTDLSVQDHFTKFDCPQEKPNLIDKMNVVKTDSIQSAVNTPQGAYNNNNYPIKEEGFPVVNMVNDSYDSVGEFKRLDPKYPSSIIEISPENQPIDVKPIYHKFYSEYNKITKTSNITKTITYKENELTKSTARNNPEKIVKTSNDNDFPPLNTTSWKTDIKTNNDVKITREVKTYRKEQTIVNKYNTDSNLSSDDCSIQSNHSERTKRRLSSVQSNKPNILIDRRINRRSSTSSNITEL